MDKLNFNLMGAVVAAALWLAPVANATLTLEISDRDDFKATLGTIVWASDTTGSGNVTINSGLGSWIANVVTGVRSPSTDLVDVLDLNSVNVSGGAVTIFIRLSDTGFERNTNYSAHFGGTTDGSISFQSYADGSNAIFGKRAILSDSGSISAAAYSGTDRDGISMEDLYSLSISASVTHTDGFQISNLMLQGKIPEPSSLALLGVGLIGAGFVSRRKVKKTA